MPFDNDDLGVEFIWTGQGLIDIVVAGGSELPGRRTPPAGKDGETVHFRIVNLDDQSEIEMVSGVWTNATQTLARTTVYYPPSGKVSFGPGDKLVSSVFGIAQAQGLVERPVVTGDIGSGAVTAHQVYTGAATSAAAVAGVVNVDFSTLGTTVQFIIITDITTLHVDLTTPAARRDIEIYNNTEEGVTFDVRDAADAVITSNVQYRHVARLGHSGTNWVGKSVQAAVGHEHTLADISDAGTMASRNQILIGDLDTTGTQDSTTVLRGNAVFGKVGADQLENTAVTPAAYTNANITVDAQGRLTAAANGSGADAAPTRVTSNAATFVLTDAARLHANVEIFSHQATVVFEVAAAAAASSKWHIRPQHDGCTVQVTGDVGSVNGASGGAARLVNGGDAFVMVQSNAGSAPVVKVVGDVIISPTAVNTTKTYDNDDHGQDFELISGVGTQTMPTAASAIDGLYFNIFNTSGGNVTIDGADADVTLATSEVITVKKLATSLWAFGSGGVTVLDAA